MTGNRWLRPLLLGGALLLSVEPATRPWRGGGRAQEEWLWAPVAILLGVGALVGLGRWARGAPEDGAPPAKVPAWVEGVAVVVIVAVAVGCVGAMRAAANPVGALLGADAPTFVGNSIAVEAGRWEDYNPDKRVLHARLGAALAPLFGGDHVSALLAVASASVVALAPLAWLAARAAYGPLVAALAGLGVALTPLPWAYGAQPTNYALYACTVGAVLAGAAWAIRRPGALGFAAVGALAGLALAASEKSALVVLGVGIVLAAGALRAAGARGLVAIGVLVGATLATERALAPPIPYTPLAQMIVVQRHDIHLQALDRVGEGLAPTPNAWADALPSPLSGGAVEETLRVLTAPAAEDVTARVRGETKVVPETSIPRLAERVRGNLAQLNGTLGGTGPLHLGLLALGVGSLLAPSRAPRRRGAALVLVAALPSIAGALPLVYASRYLQHAVVPVIVLEVAGIAWLAAALLGPGGRRWAAAGSALVSLLWIHAVFHGEGRAWYRPSLDLSPVTRVPSELTLTGGPRASVDAARALDGLDAPVVLDCAEQPLGVLRPWDRRLVRPPDCAAALAQARPGTLLTLSRPVRPRPDTLATTEAATARGWTVEAIFDGRGGPPGMGDPTAENAVVLLRAPTR